MDTVATTSIDQEESQKIQVQLEDQNDKQQKKANKLKADYKIEKSKRIQEKVDSIALYLFPCIFLLFNSIYWPYYLFVEQNKIWEMWFYSSSEINF